MFLALAQKPSRCVEKDGAVRLTQPHVKGAAVAMMARPVEKAGAMSLMPPLVTRSMNGAESVVTLHLAIFAIAIVSLPMCNLYLQDREPSGQE